MALVLAAGVALVLVLFILSETLGPHGNISARLVPDPVQRITLNDNRVKLRNDARVAVIQVAGGLLLVSGAIVGWRQLHISREGQLTERFTRAVDQLGNKQMDVRVGAIYALERIAAASKHERIVVADILSSYVQVHAPKWNPQPQMEPQAHTHLLLGSAPSNVLERPEPAKDVTAAIRVLARGGLVREDFAHFFTHLDLEGLDLQDLSMKGWVIQSSNLRSATFVNADLSTARFGAGDLTEAFMFKAKMNACGLERVTLTNALLAGADLTEAYLPNADLRGACLDAIDLGSMYPRDPELRDKSYGPAKLRHATLTGADLTGAHLAGVDLTGADLTGATLEGTDLCGAILVGVQGLTDDQLAHAMISAETVRP